MRFRSIENVENSLSIKRGNHGFAADYPVAEVHLDFRAAWQINLHARPELNQADAFAALDGVVLIDPRHDAARDEAGDEAHADFFAARLGGVKADEHVFIEPRGIGFHRVEVLTGRVPEKSDAARHRRTLDMNVN